MLIFFDIIGSANPFWEKTGISDVLGGAICILGVFILVRWLKSQSLLHALDQTPVRGNSMTTYQPFMMLFVWLLIMAVFQIFVASFYGDDMDQSRQIVSYTGLLLIEGGMVCGFLFIAAKYFEGGIKGYGIDFSTLRQDIRYGVVNYIAVFPVVMLLLFSVVFFVGLFSGQEYQMPRNDSLEVILESDSVFLKILVVFSAAFFVPIFEEMLFRGLIQSKIRQILGNAWLAILLSSLIFVFMHSIWQHWPALMALSICMGYAYEKSGSLLRPIIIHIIFNSVNVAATLLY